MEARVGIEPRWIRYALISTRAKKLAAIPITSLVTLAAAVLGGIYRAFQAAQKDLIDALAYELRREWAKIVLNDPIWRDCHLVHCIDDLGFPCPGLSCPDLS